MFYRRNYQWGCTDNSSPAGELYRKQNSQRQASATKSKRFTAPNFPTSRGVIPRTDSPGRVMVVRKRSRSFFPEAVHLYTRVQLQSSRALWLNIEIPENHSRETSATSRATTATGFVTGAKPRWAKLPELSYPAAALLHVPPCCLDEMPS